MSLLPDVLKDTRELYELGWESISCGHLKGLIIKSLNPLDFFKVKRVDYVHKARKRPCHGPMQHSKTAYKDKQVLKNLP